MATYRAGVKNEALAHQISANIHELTLLTSHVQKVLDEWGQPEVRGQLLHTLKQKQQQGSQLAKETDKLLKTFSSPPATPEQRMKGTNLLRDFSDALNAFQKTQRKAAVREKQLLAEVRAASRESVSQSDGGYGKMAPLQSSQLQLTEEEVTEEDLRLIREKESTIAQLESDITDINEIFKDLAMMIHEQGDVIDSIEASVENSEINVQKGTQQLQQAARWQMSRRKKILTLAVVVAVVIVIIALIIWGALKG